MPLLVSIVYEEQEWHQAYKHDLPDILFMQTEITRFFLY